MEVVFEGEECLSMLAALEGVRRDNGKVVERCERILGYAGR
jgi:hypothetical protein